jgi:hypothetical protein
VSGIVQDIQDALFALRVLRFLITNIKIKFQKCTFFLSFLSSSTSLSSILSPFRLHSVFLLVPFSLISLSISHVLNCLFFYSTLCTFFALFPIPVFSLLVPTTKSRHHFSFFYTLSFQVLRNFLSCTPLTFPVVSGFFDSFPSFLLVCVFVPFSRLLLLIFPLLHWHTGFSNRISLSPSSPYFLFSLIPAFTLTLPLLFYVTWRFSVHS